MKIKSLCVTIITLLVSTTQAYAIPSTDLQSINNGVVTFDSASKTTTVTTNAVKNSVTDAYWNRLNVGVGETLNNSFSATGQTIIHRVMGNELSTIAGSINSIGVGAGTGKVVLINPNGVMFNGATVNVAGLLVSTLGVSSVSPTGNIINLSGGSNKDIQIYNSTINAFQGAAFVTNGNIDVRKSNITTQYNVNGVVDPSTYGSGNIQLVTADGVNFVFVTDTTNNIEGAKAHFVIDSRHKSSDPTDSIVTASIGQNDASKTPKSSTISISNSSNIDCGGKAYVLLSVNNTTAAPSNVIVYGNSAIKNPKGAITITARNTNSAYGNVTLYKNTTLVVPKPTFFYQDISGTHSTVTNSSTSTLEPELVPITTYTTDCTKSWTANKNQAQLDAEAAAAKAAADAAAKAAADAQAAADKLAADQAAAAKAQADKLAADKEKARLAAEANTNSINPEKYIPKVIDSPQSLALGQSPSTTNAHSTPIAGAAAKVRRKQNSKFIGYPDKQNSTKMKYYEILN